MEIELKDVFDGKTYTHSVEMRTDHPASSYGQPVMEFDDGTLCNAETWLLGCGRIIEVSGREIELFKNWESLIATLGGCL